MALPSPGMVVERPRTALVVTDLQNDFLSAGGPGWELPIMMVLRAGRAGAERLHGRPSAWQERTPGSQPPVLAITAGGPAAAWWLRSTIRGR